MCSLNAVSAVVFAVGALSGCNRAAPPPPSPHVATMTFLGYSFTLEREGDGPSGVEGHRNSTRGADGKETNLDEEIAITCGNQTAKISNGKLTAGDKDRGTVKPGDAIKFNSSGKLSVNGVER